MPQTTPVKKLVIDTDIGVDDAAAIAWLFYQREIPLEILGITTVAGNASLKDVTRNMQLLLQVSAHSDLPLIMGVAKPLRREPSGISSLLHGPDGLWFAAEGEPYDFSALPTDAPHFYREVSQQHPGATLLALGPLTNLAQTQERYPEVLAQFGEIVILGGSLRTCFPFDDFNLWEDPEAADIIFRADLPLTMITVEAEDKFRLLRTDLDALRHCPAPAAQFIAPPMIHLADAFEGFREEADINFSDVAAAMIALKPELAAESGSALVKIVTHNGLAQGQTFIARTVEERVKLIAGWDELNMIGRQAFDGSDFDLQMTVAGLLSREPDNATVVTDIHASEMRRWFMDTMTRSD